MHISYVYIQGMCVSSTQPSKCSQSRKNFGLLRELLKMKIKRLVKFSIKTHFNPWVGHRVELTLSASLIWHRFFNTSASPPLSAAQYFNLDKFQINRTNSAGIPVILKSKITIESFHDNSNSSYTLISRIILKIYSQAYRLTKWAQIWILVLILILVPAVRFISFTEITWKSPKLF